MKLPAVIHHVDRIPLQVTALDDHGPGAQGADLHGRLFHPVNRIDGVMRDHPASNRFGVTTDARGNSTRTSSASACGFSRWQPLLETITGSTTILAAP